MNAAFGSVSRAKGDLMQRANRGDGMRRVADFEQRVSSGTWDPLSQHFQERNGLEAERDGETRP